MTAIIVPADSMSGKLREARAYLVQHGWNRGEYGGPDGSVCMMGAVYAVLFGDAYDTREVEIVEQMRSLLMEATGSEVAYPAWWNDAPERTQAEVLAVFDRAIQLAEAAE